MIRPRAVVAKRFGGIRADKYRTGVADLLGVGVGLRGIGDGDFEMFGCNSVGDGARIGHIARLNQYAAIL